MRKKFTSAKNTYNAIISADVYCRVLDMTRNLSYPTEDRRGSAPSIGLLLRGGGGKGGRWGSWDLGQDCVEGFWMWHHKKRLPSALGHPSTCGDDEFIYNYSFD